MMKSVSKLGLLALVATIALPLVAEAGPRRAARGVYEDEPPAASARYAGRCQAWCDRDYSPCDPANFKIADGRCAGLSSYDGR
jgi:hypothetical protein